MRAAVGEDDEFGVEEVGEGDGVGETGDGEGARGKACVAWGFVSGGKEGWGWGWTDRRVGRLSGLGDWGGFVDLVRHGVISECRSNVADAALRYILAKFGGRAVRMGMERGSHHPLFRTHCLKMSISHAQALAFKPGLAILPSLSSCAASHMVGLIV